MPTGNGIEDWRYLNLVFRRFHPILRQCCPVFAQELLSLGQPTFQLGCRGLKWKCGLAKTSFISAENSK